MAELSHFEIHLDASGHRVVLDGKDISEQVKSISIHKPEPFLVPSVILEIPGKVDIEGEGLMFIGNGPDVDQLIGEMDPNEIEQEALMRAPAGASVTGAVLQIVAERLRGSR